ncbi:hypothetical protein LSUCC0031_00365 [Rhodobacterales bacterium LSUCC0031]|nr:hypothetical protein [Rhodobacterales bacterium LSUCC0031]
MGNDRSRFLGLFSLANPLKRIERALRAPHIVPLRDLLSFHQSLRHLRGDVDRLTALTSSEMVARLSVLDHKEQPDQCDWAERAAPWRLRLAPQAYLDFASPLSLGTGVSMFHDANNADLCLRQTRRHGHKTDAAYGLVLEVYRFDGSFISMVQDLSWDALHGLSLGHCFRVQLTLDRERPIEIYARLNIQHGPNHEKLVRQFAFDKGQAIAEFDLAYSKINEKRIEKAWVDLILEGPEMNRIAIWDMVMSRAPRADF